MSSNADDSIALRELLLEEGEEFIEAAYLALLNRRPDAKGGPAYLRSLRNGTPKLGILYELHSSDEARLIGAEVKGLAEAFAREGMTDAAAVARAAAGIESAEQLLLTDDPDQFVRIAYRVLLKRPADLQGIADYLARMRAGVTRTRILYELYSSDECRELGTELPGLREAFRREGLVLAEGADSDIEQVRPAQSLQELLGRHGVEFVECAFITLTRRPADPAVLRQQTTRLHEGEAKLQLLSELVALPLGAGARGHLPGLAAAIRRHRLGKVPVLGFLVRLITGSEGDTRTERLARGHEQRIFALESQLAAQIKRGETARIRSEALAKQALQGGRELEARVASLERSDVALRKLMARYMEDGPELDPTQSAHVPHVASSRLVQDMRVEEIFRDLRRAER